MKKVEKYPFNPLIPYCIEGERAAPPEDCGGIYSYPELVQSLVDKKHQKHKGNKEWSNNFDPEVFSVAQANSYMAAMYVWCFKKKRSSYPLSGFNELLGTRNVWLK